MYFFTADLHLDHDNIRRHCNRPFTSCEQMNDVIVRNWNCTITNRDTVYVLGDFAWKRHGHFQSLLKGKKILIKGNHDKMSQDYYRNFTAVYDLHWLKIENQHVMLCHYAMRTWRNKVHGSWHFYGHSHGTLSEYSDQYSCDVGVDVWDFRPVPWEVLVAKMTTREPRKDLSESEIRKNMQAARAQLLAENQVFLKRK